MLHLYRSLLACRRASPALRTGSYEPFPAPSGVLAFRRRAGTDERLVAVNTTHSEQQLTLDAPWCAQLTSDRGSLDAASSGTLAADQAIILRHAG
jgi:alpha-glucosidase